MQIDTRAGPFAITNPTANITAASITNPVPTLTEPTGDGVLNIGSPEGGITPNGLLIIPYGVGTATNTFTMNVYGWRHTSGYGGAQKLWVPYMLASFTCTLSTTTGVAGADLVVASKLCDTIALITGNANISNEIISPTGNAVAHIILSGKGSTKVEFRFGTGSSATSCNALAAMI